MKLNKAYSCAELSVILEAKCEKNKSNIFDTISSLTNPSQNSLGFIFQDKISNIENKFRTKQQSLQKELQGKQNSELQRIRVIVEKAINKFAEDNGYDLILRADGTTLFAKKYIDITQDIINILN